MTQNLNKRKSSNEDPENAICLGQTNIEQEAFSFVWEVTNYSAMSELEKFNVGGPKTKHSWQLIMYPKKSINGVEYISLYLRLLVINNKKDDTRWWQRLWSPAVKAKFHLTILNRDGQVGHRKGLQAHEFKAPCGWGWDKFISCSDLENLNLVVDNKLNIRCEMEIFGDVKQSVRKGGSAESSPSEEQRIKRSKFGIADDLGKMFKDSVATDVTVSTGKSSFKAHKTILAARSSVFASMFSSNMIEKETATVEIKDFEDEVVKGMLEHLYAGQTDCMQERAPELLEIADKYELVGLKEDCQYEIADKLDKENAAVILVLAHSHKALYLKQRTMDFTNLHKEELLKSKSFQDAVEAHSDTAVFADLYLSQLLSITVEMTYRLT